jgi:hypothetical protein
MAGRQGNRVLFGAKLERSEVKKSKHPRLRTHIRKGANGQVWVSYWYDMRGTGKPDVPLGKDYAEALAGWHKLHNHQPMTIGRVQEAIDRWRDEVLPTYDNAGTKKQYTKNLKTIEAWCGKMAWHEITLPMLRQYLRKRTAKFQGNREMSVLQIVWGFALMEGITTVPWAAAGVKGWKNEEREREFEVTDELFAAVYEHADEILRKCMDLATTTGMRLGDTITCRVPQDGKLRFKAGKTGKWDYFTVEKSPVLTELMTRRGNVDSVMVITTSTGRQVSYGMLRTRYDNARIAAAAAYPKLAASIKAMYLRDMRSRAADLADDLEDASKLLQHSSIAVTKKHYRNKGSELKAVR